MIDVRDLHFHYPCGKGLDSVDLTVQPGEFVGIIGPNGSGKSTLLRSIYRDLRAQSGEILLDGKPLSSLSYKDSAQILAVLSQENEMSYDYTVRELVEMGRYPYASGLFERSRKEKQNESGKSHSHKNENEWIETAMEQTGLASLTDKSFFALSGGEKQRVLLTRAIVQDTPVLILDEPTNHLDLRCQMQVFTLVRNLDKTVLAAIHDLNLASLFCDRIIVMKDGKICMQGTPEEVISESMIREIFGVEAMVMDHPIRHKPYVIFL